MASLQLNQNVIQTLADRIVEARRLHGPDSGYIIGLFAGLEWLLDGSDSGAARRQIIARVLDVEAGKAVGETTESAPATPSARSSADNAARGKGEGLEENSWIRGAVKWFNNDKGYGFISTAADTDVFVHWRDISSWDRSLAQGDEVEFMVTKTAKGFQAINVMKPGAAGEEAGAGEARAGQAAAAGASGASAAEAKTAATEKDRTEGAEAADEIETPVPPSDSEATDEPAADVEVPDTVAAPPAEPEGDSTDSAEAPGDEPAGPPTV